MPAADHRNCNISQRDEPHSLACERSACWKIFGSILPPEATTTKVSQSGVSGLNKAVASAIAPPGSITTFKVSKAMAIACTCSSLATKPEPASLWRMGKVSSPGDGAGWHRRWILSQSHWSLDIPEQRPLVSSNASGCRCAGGQSVDRPRAPVRCQRLNRHRHSNRAPRSYRYSDLKPVR